MDKILEYFIKEPEREFHVRELARLAKRSPTTISRYLEKLKKENQLIPKKKLNHLLYKANTENPFFKDEKLHYNIKNLRKSGLIDYLVDSFNNPEAIVLFGSFRKAEDTYQSDIDILIVTPSKKKVDVSKFIHLIDHEIQLFIHSRKEIEEMKKTSKELMNNWINGIVLHGFWEVFR
ncbi:MAG: nucleotidyltransferase domain-containing protein [Candidatus Woesearchaeota archaeon]|nr:MAG: nucleotidyltransferase domain-containing protein [Candidatus Woesearchaeota archaeon]